MTKKARVRKLNEGATATILLAGVDLAVALSFVLRGRGALRAALDGIGILEEWALLLVIAAVVMLCGVVFPRSAARPWGFVVNMLALGATYTMILVYAPGLATASIGLVLLLCVGASAALLWLEEREDAEAYQDRRGEHRRAGQV